MSHKKVFEFSTPSLTIPRLPVEGVLAGEVVVLLRGEVVVQLRPLVPNHVIYTKNFKQHVLLFFSINLY